MTLINVSNASMLTVINRVNNKFCQSTTTPLKHKLLSFCRFTACPLPGPPYDNSFVSCLYKFVTHTSFSPPFHFAPDLFVFWMLSIMTAPILVTAVRFLPDRLELVSSSELAES